MFPLLHFNIRIKNPIYLRSTTNLLIFTSKDIFRFFSLFNINTFKLCFLEQFTHCRSKRFNFIINYMMLYEMQKLIK